MMVAKALDALHVEREIRLVPLRDVVQPWAGLHPGQVGPDVRVERQRGLGALDERQVVADLGRVVESWPAITLTAVAFSVVRHATEYSAGVRRGIISGMEIGEVDWGCVPGLGEGIED